MAVFPCKFSTPCLDPASPVQNLSAEASDGPDFLGLGFPFVSANNPVGGQGGGNFPPPFYFAEGCMNVCVSEISQEDANLCAQRSAYICAHTPPPGGPPAPAFFFSGLQVCNITCPDGSIFSYRVLPGAFVATSQAEADQQASAYACAAGAFNLICLSDLPNGCLNTPYSSTITTSERGTPPFVFTLTAGALPPGLSMQQVDAVSALLSGTPTMPGNYTFTLRLTDGNGNFMERTYVLAVIGIINSPPPGKHGTAYSFSFAALGGTPPYTFFVASGALPDGLAMDSAGNITGIPVTNATFAFTVRVTDTAQNSCSASDSIQITQSNCPDFTTLSWGSGYFEGSGGGGTESIFPVGAGLSSSFSMAVDGNVFAGSAACRNAGGTASYVGPACKCNLHVVVSANVGTITGAITVISALAGILLAKNETTLPVGTFDFPFTVPDTGGNPDSISVFIQAQTVAPAPVPRSFHCTGVFTNV